MKESQVMLFTKSLVINIILANRLIKGSGLYFLIVIVTKIATTQTMSTKSSLSLLNV